MLEALNQAWFLGINASQDLNTIFLILATFIAQDLIYVAPLTLIGLWLWGKDSHINAQRMLVINAGMAMCLTLFISLVIRYYFPHPRPFVLPLGHQLLSHKANASFPSNHGSVIFSVAMIFLFSRKKLLGTLFLFLGIAIAWSRIFLGIHWPMDMIGAFFIAIISSLFSLFLSRYFGKILLTRLTQLYRWIFGFAIKRKWITA